MVHTLKNDKDYSISFIRLIAMLCIFACHIFQAYHFILGGWFDVGVQIFFFISGYLYSYKKISNIINFYIKNVYKLLSDYYVFIFILLGLLFCVGKFPNVNNIINLLILKSNIPGTQHLWFIRFILTCYLCIPIFQNILNFIDTKNKKYFLFLIIVFSLLIELFFSGILKVTGAWFVCFFLGMAYTRIEKNKIVSKIVFIYSLILTLILSLLRIYSYYKLDLPYYLYRYVWCYSHIFLGITVFIITRSIYFRLQNVLDLKKILTFSDIYSYDFYIVHYSLIVGYFSLIILIPNKIFACILTFIGTCMESVFLHFFVNRIKEVFRRVK